jgi:cellulase
MAPSLPLIASVLVGLVAAQTPIGTPDLHPKLQTWKCTNRGGCVSQNTALVLDSGTHWIHQRNDSSKACTSSSTSSGLDASVCPDAATCAQNCVIEGITDYASHGVVTNGSALHMRQLASDGSTLSPRLYLLAEGEKEYEMLQLTGNELSYDVDVSALPCGMNGALYLSEMSSVGGDSPLNKAGAAYGTGYCDAQCFTQPFINGVVS